jgi:hypothetical protein
MYSPYGPWGLDSDDGPIQAQPPGLFDSPDELLVLSAGVDFGTLLAPAALTDWWRAAGGVEDCEGAESWLPPSGQPCTTACTDNSADSANMLPIALPFPPKIQPADKPSTMGNPSAFPVATGPASACTVKQREAKKVRQARKRQERVCDPLMAKITAALSQHWSALQILSTAYSIIMPPATECGYMAWRPHLESHDRSRPWTLQELAGCGFWLLVWDGR